MSSRVDIVEHFIGPRLRLLWVLGLLGAIIVSRTWLTTAALVLEFYTLAFLAGKRIQILYFTGLLASIVLFSLLNPFGRVLVNIGPWPITLGALEEGLSRGLRLVGMVFLSVAGIHRALRLPGRFGVFFSEVLGFYDRLLESRKKVRLNNWVESVDGILTETFPLPNGPEYVQESPTQHKAGIIRPLLFFGSTWGFTAFLMIILPLHPV